LRSYSSLLAVLASGIYVNSAAAVLSLSAMPQGVILSQAAFQRRAGLDLVSAPGALAEPRKQRDHAAIEVATKRVLDIRQMFEDTFH
jgi:hypothetical protein